MKAHKLKKLCGDGLRDFVCKKQWEKFVRGPEVVHNKPYPIMPESIAKRNILICENHLNPEFRGLECQ